MTKRSAPVMELLVNGATNRIMSAGYGYDNNGNLTSMLNNRLLSYDGENRLTAINFAGTKENYAYAPDNKRVMKYRLNEDDQPLEELVYYYAPWGQRLGTYLLHTSGGFFFERLGMDVHFAGKLIRSNGGAVALDRLGSVRTGRRYFPYGEEAAPATPNDRDKFGTYYRDATTGLDYADQRYYSSTHGRFLTPDPYRASGGVGNPGSWNRYAYVEGDPVNFADPRGWCVVATAEGLRPGADCYEEVNINDDSPASPVQAGGDGNSLSDFPLWLGLASAALWQKDCYEAVGASSASEAVLKLHSLTFRQEDLGFASSVDEDASAGRVSLKWQFDYARYTDGTVLINSNPNLNDLSNIFLGTGEVTGSAYFANEFANFEDRYGLKKGAVNLILYQAIFISHELGHAFGTGKIANDHSDDGDRSKSIENTGKIIDDCFKWLK